MAAQVKVAREVLLVGLGEGARGELDQAVLPLEARTTAVALGRDGAAAAMRREWDALVVAHPLPGGPTAALLHSVRRPGSPCRRSGLVLLAEEPERHAAQAYLGRGANRVLTLAEGTARLTATLDQLFRVAPRVPLRLPVRLEVAVSGHPRRFLCETVNLSASGLLVRVANSFPAGTELSFELLGVAGGRARGRARVVRTTRQGIEPYPGVGVAIDEAEPAFAEWVAHRLSSAAH